SPPAHRHLGCAAGATRKAHALRADRDRAPVVDPPGDLFGDCSSSLEVVVGGSDMAFLARRCCADDGHALDEDAVKLDARGADANARETRIDAEDEDAHRRASCLALVEAIPISSCSLVSRIRRAAMAWYFGSRSHPTKPRPRRLHATPVVPLPAKGSMTTSPGSVKSRTSASISQRGFCVGCSRLMPPPFAWPVQTAGRPPPFHFMRPETRGAWPMMTHSAPAAGRSPVI